MAPRFHDLTVAAIAPAAPDAVALSLAVPDALRGAYGFTPGQYLTLRARVGGADIRRSYSLCSLPSDPHLTVGVRRVEGGAFSGFATTGLRVGDRIAVMTPEGRFGHAPVEGDRLLLIGAGSGITPLLALARAALETTATATVTLIYGNRETASIMFRDRLDDLKDRFLTRFRLVHVLSREGQDVPLLAGRIDAEKLRALAVAGLIDPAGDTGAFLCGPGAMIDTARAALVALGLPGDRVHAEHFTPSSPPHLHAPRPRARPEAAGAVIETILDGTRRRFRVTDGADSVLAAATRAGIELPFSCAGGMCCTCRCRIVEGGAEMAVNYSLQPWEIAQGFTLACQARPTGAHLVLDFDAA